MLAALQSAAASSPNLRNSESYQRLFDGIQHCELDIQAQRQAYNFAVKEYNKVCLSIPTVFIAKFIGFSKAQYLEFDISGMQGTDSVTAFTAGAGERLQQLGSWAGGGIASATKALEGGAGQAGKLLINKVKEHSAGTQYFYMIPGGTPKGPVGMETIREL